MTGGMKVASAKTEEVGKIEFCDFDFGEHSIRVDAYGFLSMTVSGIRMDYTYTYMLTVVLNYNRGHVGSNACTVALRVKDTEGRRIPFPLLIGNDSQGNVSGDQFGRIRSFVLLHERRTIIVRAEGYTPAEMTIECHQLERYERTIVLHTK